MLTENSKNWPEARVTVIDETSPSLTRSFPARALISENGHWVHVLDDDGIQYAIPRERVVSARWVSVYVSAAA